MKKYNIVGFGQLLVDKLYNENGECIKIDGGDTVWNILYNLSMMGEKCYAIGTAGKDEYAKIAIESLNNVGVNTIGIQLNDEKTNVLYGIITNSSDFQDIVYTDRDPNTKELTVTISNNLPNKIPEILDLENIIVVFMNLQKSNLAFLKNVKGEKKVILDIGHKERIDEVTIEEIDNMLKKVNICQINEKVINALLTRLNIGNVEQLMDKYQFELLMLTKGSKGAEMFFINDGKIKDINLHSQIVEKNVEPSGAGDMFLSVFIKAYNHYLAQGKNIDEEFIRKTFSIANRMAAKVVTFIGARGQAEQFNGILTNDFRDLDEGRI